nr:MAG TPA: hypothetical protein [Caudoviricetes sp.]
MTALRYSLVTIIVSRWSSYLSRILNILFLDCTECTSFSSIRSYAI